MLWSIPGRDSPPTSRDFPNSPFLEKLVACVIGYTLDLEVSELILGEPHPPRHRAPRTPLTFHSATPHEKGPDEKRFQPAWKILARGHPRLTVDKYLFPSFLVP